MTSPTVARPLPVVVLISGNGSNLQAIIDATRRDLPVEIRAVISNHPAAFGLRRARAAGIPAEVIDHRTYTERRAFDNQLQKMIDAHDPALVVLAGFMRILSPAFVEHYKGRIINIHPSLLPAFTGLNTHQRALAAGVSQHGASVHFVTEQLDGGPVILQARVPVMPGDTAESLAARVLEKEHGIYPLALRWLAEGRIRLEGETVIFDGAPLHGPIDYERITSDTPAPAPAQ